MWCGILMPPIAWCGSFLRIVTVCSTSQQVWGIDSLGLCVPAIQIALHFAVMVPKFYWQGWPSSFEILFLGNLSSIIGNISIVPRPETRMILSMMKSCIQKWPDSTLIDTKINQVYKLLNLYDGKIQPEVDNAKPEVGARVSAKRTAQTGSKIWPRHRIEPSSLILNWCLKILCDVT